MPARHNRLPARPRGRRRPCGAWFGGGRARPAVNRRSRQNRQDQTLHVRPLTHHGASVDKKAGRFRRRPTTVAAGVSAGRVFGQLRAARLTGAKRFGSDRAELRDAGKCEPGGGPAYPRVSVRGNELVRLEGEHQKLWYAQAGTGGYFGGRKSWCMARKTSS